WRPGAGRLDRHWRVYAPLAWVRASYARWSPLPLNSIVRRSGRLLGPPAGIRTRKPLELLRFGRSCREGSLHLRAAVNGVMPNHTFGFLPGAPSGRFARCSPRIFGISSTQREYVETATPSRLAILIVCPCSARIAALTWAIAARLIDGMLH